MAAGFFSQWHPKNQKSAPDAPGEQGPMRWKSLGISVMRPDILRKQMMLELLDVQKIYLFISKNYQSLIRTCLD